jgi:hypothetical protein
VVAGFAGGKMTSEAGAPLLGATDRAIRLVEPRLPFRKSALASGSRVAR